MILSLFEAPAVAELLATVKAQSRVDANDEDELILSQLLAALARIDGRDGFLGRALLTQTWDLWLNRFYSPIYLPLAPVQTISFVKYADSDGVLQTLAPEDYQLDLQAEPSRLLSAYGAAWPASQSVPNAVNVRFVAGYGDKPEDIPEPLVQYLRVVVNHWYENRGATSVVPSELDAMVLQYRVNWAPLYCGYHGRW